MKEFPFLVILRRRICTCHSCVGRNPVFYCFIDWYLQEFIYFCIRSTCLFDVFSGNSFGRKYLCPVASSVATNSQPIILQVKVKTISWSFIFVDMFASSITSTLSPVSSSTSRIHHSSGVSPYSSHHQGRFQRSISERFERRIFQESFMIIAKVQMANCARYILIFS